MFEQLLSIIKSNEFKEKLNELNDNFFNLKQEIHIRNLLVELFNQKYKEQGERAIAEYPRVARTRVDLSLIDNNTESPFKIELKYHFPKDKGGFSKYQKSIQKHFIDRGSNGFILIVCDSDKDLREKFEEKWNIDTIFPKLSKEDNIWKENLKNKFEETPDSKSYYYEVTIEKPFETTYHFFILERK